MKLFGILLMLICVNSFTEKPSAEQQALQAKFDRCKRGPASQDDLNNLLTMDEAAREIFIAQMRTFVNEEVTGLSKRLICAKASANEYSDFTNAIDRPKRKVQIRNS